MRYMDYEEFNKEYKKYEMWDEKEVKDDDFSQTTHDLLWGKKNDTPQLCFPDLDSLHLVNDTWLGIDEWTGEEDVPAKNPTRARNSIQPTGFIPDDRVNSPSHYTSGRMESIDIIEDAIQVAPTPKEGFLQGQVLKYILRVWLKDNPLEDLKKARWYLDRLIKSLE